MKLSKNTKRLLIILGVAIVFALSLMIASLLLKGKDPQPALNITGVAEDGSLTSLSDHFGKKATVLLFFDVETPKALELLEQIDALAPKYDAEVMAVACHGKMEEQKELKRGICGCDWTPLVPWRREKGAKNAGMQCAKDW